MSKNNFAPFTVSRFFVAIKGRLLTFTLLPFFCLFKYINNNCSTKIWLIGENRGECLQENGYWFYNYCKNNSEDIDTYFIIKKLSPYYDQYALADSNILEYGSLRHIFIFCFATTCFYTHSYKDLLYNYGFKLFGSRKRLVYLHHGVLGFKKFDSFYRKNKDIMDLFIVGNNIEKNILVKDEQIIHNKVVVTGYARYDNPLFTNNPILYNQILYIPTHRNYINFNHNNKTFFLNKIQSLISNKLLLGMLEKNSIIFKIYLHKELQKFTNNLHSYNKNIVIINFHEESPQELISKSKLMITDYSSVSWDFLFLGKPIIFYRFDSDKYLKDRDSYIDLKKDIFGEIVYEENDLIDIIQNYIDTDFVLKSSYCKFKNDIFPTIRTNNCNRIHHEVNNLIHNCDNY